MAHDEPAPVMSPTGERMVPQSAHVATFWEHIYRYRFACRYAKDRRVLDVASGEGYGLAGLLAAGAREGVGVDVSEEACQHARARYHVDCRVGSAEAMPLDDASVDLITSFETIEHVGSPRAFLAECRRVLRPGGRLVLSTPVSETYGTQNPNEFHVSEMTEAQSRDLIGELFVSPQWFAQRPHTTPSWRVEAVPGEGVGTRAVRLWRNFVARLSVKSGRSGRLYGSDYWRDHPDEAIMANTGRLPLNPYRVRPRAAFGGAGPQFLVVVAISPGKA